PAAAEGRPPVDPASCERTASEASGCADTTRAGGLLLQGDRRGHGHSRGYRDVQPGSRPRTAPALRDQSSGQGFLAEPCASLIGCRVILKPSMKACAFPSRAGRELHVELWINLATPANRVARQRDCQSAPEQTGEVLQLGR